MRLTAWCASTAFAALASAASPTVQAPSAQPVDNAELARMSQEDQDDRKPGLHGIDWAIVKPRDDARLARARELYVSGALHTGTDWFNAALLLQHSSEADDYLLAHEMSVAAVAKGEASARWLIAAAEDRYLMKIGRKQRFGTQYEPATEPGTYRLAPVEPQVTDGLREAIGAPSLAEAKATESRFNKK